MTDPLKDDKEFLGAQSAAAVESACSIDTPSASHAAPKWATENIRAFPTLDKFERFNDALGYYEEHYAPHGGMSLRDYFAAKAMQAQVTTCAAPAIFGLDGAEDDCARAAYKIADAMLKAREAK